MSPNRIVCFVRMFWGFHRRGLANWGNARYLWPQTAHLNIRREVDGSALPTCVNRSSVSLGDTSPVEDFAAMNERLAEALDCCIPWVGANPRGAAQEALAVACDLVGSDPYDWSAAPDVLTRRRELLGLPPRRSSEPCSPLADSNMRQHMAYQVRSEERRDGLGYPTKKAPRGPVQLPPMYALPQPPAPDPDVSQ